MRDPWHELLSVEIEVVGPDCVRSDRQGAGQVGHVLGIHMGEGCFGGLQVTNVVLRADPSDPRCNERQEGSQSTQGDTGSQRDRGKVPFHFLQHLERRHEDSIREEECTASCAVL